MEREDTQAALPAGGDGRICVRQAIVVEGRYDKAKLLSYLDGIVIETDGFRVFSDQELQAFLRRMAQERGVIVLTDSDAAGFRIRAFLTSILPADRVTHALIPDVFGKERRKAQPSKEGKLGVEGMEKQVLLEALRRAGAERTAPAGAPVTPADLYDCGLTGGAGSAARRRQLLRALGLPQRTSISLLLRVVNATMTREAFLAAAAQAAQTPGDGADTGR